MADNVAVTTLEIRGTEKVATTMKELKEQIKSYRDELVVLGQVEDKDEQQKAEQVAVIERLQKATKLLSEVTNAHKQSMEGEARQVDIMNDSYNALQAELTRLKKAYKEMAAAERESDLGAETLANIQQLDIKLKDLDAGMGQYQRNVGNYGQTFEESMGKARQNCGFLEQGMGTLLSVMSLAGTENKALVTTIAGLQLALQAFNNEGVQKVIISIKEWIAAKIAARAAEKAHQAEVQATTAAMTAEAAATQTATVATNTLKKALIATGIGAIIALIGTLIANWEKVAEVLGLAKEATEEETEAMKEAKKATEEFNKSVGTAIGNSLAKFTQLQAQYRNLRNDMEKKQWIKDNANAFADLGIEVNNLNSAENAFVRNTKSVVDALVKRAMATAKEQQLVSLSSQYMEARLTAEEEVKRKRISAGDEVISPGKDGFTTKGGLMQVDSSGKWVYTSAGAQNANATITKEAYARANQLKAQMDKIANELARDYKNISTTSRGSSGVSSPSPDKATGSTDTEGWMNETEEDIMAAHTAEEEAILYEMELYEQAAEAARAARAARANALHEETKAHAEALEEQRANEEAFREWQKETALSTSETLASATASMFDAIANAIEATAEDEEETAKKTKGLRIAGATMTMLQGIVSAVATAMAIPPPVGPILGAINAATVLATGTANIAKIKATDVATGSSPGGADVPSASVNVPTIHRSLPATQILTSASDEARLNKMASDQRVKLVYSDLEVASTDQRVKVEESSF